MTCPQGEGGDVDGDGNGDEDEDGDGQGFSREHTCLGGVADCCLALALWRQSPPRPQEVVQGICWISQTSAVSLLGLWHVEVPCGS